MPSPPRPLPPGAPPGSGARRRRWVAFALLAAAVLAVHGWLLRSPELGWGKPLVRPGPQAEGRALAMQVVAASLPPAATAAAPGAAGPQPRPTGNVPTESSVPEASPTPLAAPSPKADSPRGPALSGPRVAAASPQPRAEPQASAEALAPPLPVPADAASVRAAEDSPPVASLPASAAATAAAAATASAEQAEAGRPPPVYETQLPPARNLRYRAERAGAVGVAELVWEPTPDAYILRLQASLPAGPPIDWRSQGGFDSAGLAPLRMVERQKQRDLHAVNFQRDKGVISFSGPSREVALWRGAQDRLSWLIQLTAVAQARRGTAQLGEVVRMQVATPRGDVDEWVFTLASTEPLETAGLRWAAQKWVREPARPYDQRVEVWLAPAAGHLPLGLRWTTVPGGEPLALWLTEGLRAEL